MDMWFMRTGGRVQYCPRSKYPLPLLLRLRAVEHLGRGRRGTPNSTVNDADRLIAEIVDALSQRHDPSFVDRWGASERGGMPSRVADNGPSRNECCFLPLNFSLEP